MQLFSICFFIAAIVSSGDGCFRVSSKRPAKQRLSTTRRPDTSSILLAGNSSGPWEPLKQDRSPNLTLSEWSPWSQCGDIGRARACPKMRHRWRLCPEDGCPDNGTDTDAQICSYSHCPDNLYEHTLQTNGICNPVEPLANVISAPQPVNCAKACNEFMSCQGFIYYESLRSCYLLENWCQSGQLIDSQQMVAYKKTVPKNFVCGKLECFRMEQKLSSIDAMESWHHCSEICSAIPACRAFQWGPTEVARIELSDLYLNCTLFTEGQCMERMTSTRARLCEKL